MKIKFNRMFVLPLIGLIFSLILFNCGDSSTSSNNSNSNYIHPSIPLKVGNTYTYTNDSIPNGGNPILLPIKSYDTIKAAFNFSGKYGYQIFDRSKNTITNTQVAFDTIYLSYDSTNYKLYQFGVQKFINPALPAQWDLIGDFSQPVGQPYNIGSVDYTVNIPTLGSIEFTGPLTAKIAIDTTITTTNNITPKTVKCVRIELSANISGNAPPPLSETITASIVFDDFIGYASGTNPCGIVAIRLRPFNFTTSGLTLVKEPGFDRFLSDWTP